MNSLKIERQNGNVPKSVAGEDHVSGFIAYLAEAEIPEGFKTDHVQAVSTIDAAETLGIKDDAESWGVRVLHYQLSEISASIRVSRCTLAYFRNLKVTSSQKSRRYRTSPAVASGSWPSGAATRNFPAMM